MAQFNPSPAAQRRTGRLSIIVLVIVYLFIIAQTMMAQENAPGGEIFQGNNLSYLPVVFKPMPVINLNPIGRPNSANQWGLIWSSGGADLLRYEVQEAHNSAFTAGLTSYNPGTATSIPFNHPPSLDNIYYYRVRAIYSHGSGPWSNVRSVQGGWRDDFNDFDSGWEMRRTTYLEYTIGYYQDGTFTIIVDDDRDWTIFSPLVPAPEPPYAIEYVARLESPANHVSHGAVYGGDWNGQPCPDYNSWDGIYRHHNCFNQFYNNNFNWDTARLRINFERVDFLYWCPETPDCEGEPLLRRSVGHSFAWTVLPDDDGAWHTWRIEVRPTGLKMFVDGIEFASDADTTFVNNPYFGLFAATNEFTRSTLITDYYQVTYLDQ